MNHASGVGLCFGEAARQLAVSVARLAAAEGLLIQGASDYAVIVTLGWTSTDDLSEGRKKQPTVHLAVPANCHYTV